MPSRTWRSAPWGWRALRRSILARDGYRCQVKGPGCTLRATAVHHVHGIAVTGVMCDPSFLVAVCVTCNARIGEPKGDPAPSASTQW